VIHAILVGDTDDEKIGDAAKKNIANMTQLLEAEIPAEFLKVQTVSGKECNARTIIETIRGISSTDSDTIFYYHTGHGAYDRRFAAGDPSGGHFFSLSGGDLLRKTLLENILAKPARLKVLYTESCNVPLRAHPARLVSEVRPMSAEKARPFEQLLRYHRGYVDLNAASRGQRGWVDGIGGWFTYVSLQYLQTEEEWEAFIPKVKTATSTFYKDRRQKCLEYATKNGLLGRRSYRDLSRQQDMNPVVNWLQVSRDKDIEARPLITVNSPLFVIKEGDN
jgi:hypothetical protein